MHNLAWKSYNSIHWVTCIDSWYDGPTLGVSVCTHGGEVVWLDIIDALESTLDIQKNLIRGKIFFILSNLWAYEKYSHIIAHWDKVSADHLIGTRFVDENMNRCCSLENLATSTSYEVQRILELMPILQKLDLIFDIHSTYSSSDSMIIYTWKSKNIMQWVFNVSQEITWLADVALWKPFIDIVERNEGVGIGIESGCQLDKTWYKIWLDNLSRLLKHLWMIDPLLQSLDTCILDTVYKQKIHCFWSILIKWSKFRFYKNYKHLDKVSAWELICFDWERDIYAERNCVLIMPKQNDTNTSKLIGEEWCFLGEIISV